jgi:hypothetical protein
MHAGSPSLIVACMHPSLLVGTTRALLLHTIRYSSVLSSFLPCTFSRLKDSVYCCLALALGAHNLDSSAIDLAYINRDFLCQLWVPREASEVDTRTWNPTVVALHRGH